MGNANYIGRVGALAVALGIGTAVVTTPWVAVAEPSADASSPTGSTSTDDPKPEAAEDSSRDANATAGTADAGEPTDEDPDSGNSGDESATPQAPEPAAVEDTELETEPAPTTPEQPPVSNRVAPPPATVAAALTESSNNDSPAQPQSVSVDLPEAADPGAVASTRGADDLHVPAITVSVTSARSTAPAVPTAVPTTAVSAQLVPAAQALPAPASPVSVVTGLVSGLLAWVGLSPGLSTAPAAPAQAPLLWGLLAWVRREVERTMFNKTPTTAYNPAENSQSVDGVITGDLNAVDADGDPLSFIVSQAPQNGTVVVNTDGTFVYTPSAQLAATGGTDVFTVKVEDQGSHFHGIGAFFQPDSGHSTTATVAVTVTPMSIAVGNSPNGVAVSPDGSTVYVTNFGDLSSGGNTVSVIDAATTTVVATITVGGNPANVAVSPNGATAYVTNLDDGTVSVIDTATNSVTATIVVGDLPDGVAVSPDGAHVYVTNADDDTVSIIDAATNVVTDTVTVGENPRTVAVSPEGTRVYVTNADGASVSVINTATNAVTTIGVGELPLGVAVSPDSTRVYVTNAADDTVSVIDAATRTVIATVTVGDFPGGVAVSSDGAHVYVANIGDDTVSVIDTATNTVTTAIPVGDGPTNIAISPAGATAYVTNSNADSVSVIALPATQSSLVALQGVPAMPTSLIRLVSDLVSGLWGMVARVTEAFQRIFLNRTPTTAYDPAENNEAVDGVVTGDLNAVDADGDPLSFTLVQAPQKGTIKLHPDGTFTYTQSRDFAATGGTDVFIVKVTDEGSHFHGLRAFFQSDAGHSTTATVAIFDPKVVDTIDVGQGPTGLAVSPDGAHVYVSNRQDSTVSVIDTDIDNVTATIPVGDDPLEVAVSPDGDHVYVTSLLDGAVSVI
ncbi:MAG TPA: beta-propeller fold lactonase family protein, partial [Mycobacterium sp.]|nr:beta-propeller fold lactonase family protein [Mycobacterium sp.]